MRIAFWGTPDVAVPSLQAFIDAPDIDVVCVVTNPDRPRGRSSTPVASAVKLAALAHGIPVLQPERPGDIVSQLAALRIDACAVVAYGALLSETVLALPRHGFVNLHFSLLPRWRGAAPVQWAIRSGDSTTGITTFVLDRGMDTGPILTQHVVGLRPDDTTETVLSDLAQRGGTHLVDAVRGLVNGSITPTAQPDDGVTLAPKIGRNDVAISFAEPGHVIDQLTRSADPTPGAHAQLRGETIKIFRAVALDTPQATAPHGTIVALTDIGPVVACKDGAVALTQLQLPSKPRRDGHSVQNGLRLQLGEQFSDGLTV